MKQFTLVLFILLISGLTLVNAQIQDETVSFDSVFTFHFDTNDPDNLNSYFVKEIARYNFLNLYTTQYTLSYSLDLSIKKSTDGTILIEPTLRQGKMNGEVYYEKFDLSEVLMPTTYDFSLLMNTHSSSQTFKFTNLDFGNNTHLPLNDSREDPFQNADFKITDVSFHYDELDKETFQNRINIIHQFLGFYELLDFNLQKSKTIDPENPDSLLLTFFKIYDLKRFKEILELDEITIQLPESYEENFRENRRSLNSNLRRLETLFTQNADTLKIAISDKDLVAASQAIINLQYDYLSLMKISNHLFEPVFLKVTNFFSSPNDWAAQEMEMQETLLKKTPPEVALQKIQDFSKILYNQYIIEADTLISNEKFVEAALMVENATTLCEIKPETGCEILTFNKTAQTKYGIFDAYLRVAESAMEKGILDYAQKYVLLAKDFQSQNSDIILSSGPVEKSLEELAWKYFQNARELFDDENYGEAFDGFASAREIYDMIEISTYNDLIDKQMKKCIFDN